MLHNKALFITWAEDAWHPKHIRLRYQQFKENGFVIQEWRVKEFQSVSIGMPVIAYKQKHSHRGIFGIGYVASGPGEADYSSNGRKLPHRTFNIHFIYFADPLSIGPLIADKACPKSMDEIKRTRYSGKIIDAAIYFEILHKLFNNTMHQQEEPTNPSKAKRKKAFKYNPDNDEKNRELGYKGELQVLVLEHQKLVNLQRKDLADRIVHISVLDDSQGYDILSFDEKGNSLYIEVKTTTQTKNTPFFITANEIAASHQYKNNYRLYRLFNFSDLSFDFYSLVGPISEDIKSIELVPIMYRVNIKIDE